MSHIFYKTQKIMEDESISTKLQSLKGDKFRIQKDVFELLIKEYVLAHQFKDDCLMFNSSFLFKEYYSPELVSLDKEIKKLELTETKAEIFNVKKGRALLDRMFEVNTTQETVKDENIKAAQDFLNRLVKPKNDYFESLSPQKPIAFFKI